MLLADYIEYKLLKTFNQGASKTCTAYAFFAVLIEFIQQKYGLDVKFDIPRYFNEVEQWRGKQSRIAAFMAYGTQVGYRDSRGVTWKIKGSNSVAVTDRLLLLKTLQQYPAIIIIRRFEGHNLNDNVLKPVKRNAKEKAVGHAMLLRGFDLAKRQYIFQNSYGKKAPQFMPFDVWDSIGKSIWYFTDIYFITQK